MSKGPHPVIPGLPCVIEHFIHQASITQLQLHVDNTNTHRILFHIISPIAKMSEPTQDEMDGNYVISLIFSSIYRSEFLGI